MKSATLCGMGLFMRIVFGRVKYSGWAEITSGRDYGYETAMDGEVVLAEKAYGEALEFLCLF